MPQACKPVAAPSVYAPQACDQGRELQLNQSAQKEAIILQLNQPLKSYLSEKNYQARRI